MQSPESDSLTFSPVMAGRVIIALEHMVEHLQGLSKRQNGGEQDVIDAEMDLAVYEMLLNDAKKQIEQAVMRSIKENRPIK